MPPLSSASKAIGRLLSRKNGAELLRSSGRCRGQFRGLSSIVGVETPSVCKLIDADKEGNLSFLRRHNAVQTRCFLGCGDGEEGSVLSKTHEERRVMGWSHDKSLGVQLRRKKMKPAKRHGPWFCWNVEANRQYSPEQLFAVVAAVDLYEDFVPWCQRSQIVRHNDDGSFDAELQIGFKFLVESYVSHVELKKPKYIKTTASESGIFDHLINVWEFNPGPIPGTCDLYFLVDFKFQSPLYRQVASMFFKEVVSRLVTSFSDRCRMIYGPGIQVLENSYGEQRS